MMMRIKQVVFLVLVGMNLIFMNDVHSKLHWVGATGYYDSLSETCEAQASSFGGNAELCEITPIVDGGSYGELTGSCVIGECDGTPLAYPHWTTELYALPISPDNNQPNVCTGNPVDPVTGNKLQQEYLIKTNSLYPLVLNLFYNSNRLEKWRHTFSRDISFSSSPSGARFDFNGIALGADPIVTAESPSYLGGEITSYGVSYTAPESTSLIIYG